MIFNHKKGYKLTLKEQIAAMIWGCETIDREVTEIWLTYEEMCRFKEQALPHEITKTPWGYEFLSVNIRVMTPRKIA